jgi:hypothetical protein
MKINARSTSGKGKARATGGKGKARATGGKGKAKQASGKGKAKQASGKGKAKQASGKGKAKQASGKGKAKQASGKGKAKQASGKGSGASAVKPAELRAMEACVQCVDNMKRTAAKAHGLERQHETHKMYHNPEANLAMFGKGASKAIHPYVIGAYVAGGIEGMVTDVSGPNVDDNCVIKVARCQSAKRARDVLKAYHAAAKCGVGPGVVDGGVFALEDRSDAFHTHAYFVICPRLTKTLDASYPFRTQDVLSALDLYVTCARVGKFYQRDLKANNVMFDAEGRMFLIDMGIACRVEESTKPEEEEFEDAVRLLTTTLFVDPVNYGCAPTWKADRDKKRQDRIRTSVTEGLAEALASLPSP